jgi:hypothetical protein
VIIDLFELRCDDCKLIYGIITNAALVTYSQMRAHAKQHGWARYRVAHGELMDFCPQCKVSH